MNIEENIARARRNIEAVDRCFIKKCEKRGRPLDDRSITRHTTRYLLMDKAIEHVYIILEKSKTKKSIKTEIKQLQWQHRDGKGYALDALDNVARRLSV